MIKTFSKKPGGESAQTISCNLCGSSSHRRAFSVSGANWVKCRSCGLVYQNPQPVAIELVKRYDDEYFAYEVENEASFYNLARLGLDDIGFNSRRSEAKKRGKFLDVGCATGYLLNEVSKSGWPVEGVEICEESARYASKRGGFPVYTKPLEQLALDSGKYGVVHLSHVIEHLNDPDGFFREVYRLLAPGGYFIVTTPNIDGFQSRLTGRRWRSAIPDHLFLFSRKTLGSLALKTGFSTILIKTWGGLAAGLAPIPVKRAADCLVKPFGVGDVMIMLLQKPDIC
ncbi:MAG: class I SAM-dependent methyltransferase [Spirochaetales bacterium]|nr:class I SAM-dependent methyltransferase [Spirochaetales bacterium]